MEAMLLFRHIFTVLSCLTVALVHSQAGTQNTVTLRPGSILRVPLAPGQSARLEISLKAGESALIKVLQMGIDVVIDVYDPTGKLVESVDGPTGRTGIEVVELWSTTIGAYVLVVRPFDASEPLGKFELTVEAVRNVAETEAVLSARLHRRLAAAEWLRHRTFPLTNLTSTKRPRLWQELATTARIIGLGEATHGSVEFNDVRFAFTKALVEQSGYRLIAVEFSASRTMQLEPYLRGDQKAKAPPDAYTGWIGSAAYPKLIAWVRGWNVSHPRDKVRFLGVDEGDNAPSRALVDGFLTRAYGDEFRQQWLLAKRELEDADLQNTIFGDSGVDARARATLLQIHWRLIADAPLQSHRFGMQAVQNVQKALRILLEFADYNSDHPSFNRSRDWYMASNLLAALEELGSKARGVFWAHNAHIATTPSSSTAGRTLRDVLGSEYRAVAQTTGGGSYVAQRPNDIADRLEVSSFLPARFEKVEDVLRAVQPGPFMTLWPDDKDRASAPEFLQGPLPMHWIGGLYQPGDPPSTQNRLFRTLSSFDGIVFLPSVSAIPLPQSRPLIPSRIHRYGNG